MIIVLQDDEVQHGWAASPLGPPISVEEKRAGAAYFCLKSYDFSFPY